MLFCFHIYMSLVIVRGDIVRGANVRGSIVLIPFQVSQAWWTASQKNIHQPAESFIIVCDKIGNIGKAKQCMFRST